MENKKEVDLVSGTFTWKIDQFLNLKDKVYSEVFVIGGFKWRIKIYPKGINSKVKGYLSMYLEVADSATLPSGWTRYAKYSLTVVNQLESNKSITNGSESKFVEFKVKENGPIRGFSRFMLLSEISDLSKSYIVNGICVVEANVSARKDDIKILDRESGELLDFRGLGRVDLAFHPMLEEVCLLHPSLIECQAKRSHTYVECAFTTLGRLLHFLKTTKVKDVNQEGFERLGVLWDELETFKFNLAWLQPHVQSVFRMKYMVGRVKRMRGDITVLENEIKSRREALDNEIRRRRYSLAVAEVEVESAKTDLVKAEQGFNMICGDMNSELGYPLS